MLLDVACSPYLQQVIEVRAHPSITVDEEEQRRAHRLAVNRSRAD
jgi:hypothetical protein